jgi:hypothetical protein
MAETLRQNSQKEITATSLTNCAHLVRDNGRGIVLLDGHCSGRLLSSDRFPAATGSGSLIRSGDIFD